MCVVKRGKLLSNNGDGRRYLYEMKTCSASEKISPLVGEIGWTHKLEQVQKLLGDIG